jgi:hypothetical protein
MTEEQLKRMLEESYSNAVEASVTGSQEAAITSIALSLAIIAETLARHDLNVDLGAAFA